MALHATLSPAAPGRQGSARERLLSAALTALAGQPAVAVSLEEIRREARVSVGALYHHFADKAALLDALYLELTARVQDEFLSELHSHPGAEEGIKAIVRWYLRWVSGNRVAASVLLGSRPADPALREMNRRFFAEVMSWWQTHVHYRTLREVPLDLIHALWLGPSQEYSRHWLAGEVDRIPRNVADVLGDAAWNALKETT